tara:strand:- start:19 stop:183 length:165 start_codon:yes stop_codon:yes gene_type:complete
MKRLRKEMQATLDTENERSRYGDWDYDVETWIEVLEMVLGRIDWIQENINDEEE